MKLSLLIFLPALALLCACGSSSGGASPRIDGGPSENDPGTLVITAPARGAYVPTSGSALITVTGSGASPALTLDGQPVQVNSDGTFQATIACSVGFNLVQAVDGANRLDVPFLYGDFRPPSQEVGQAIAVRVNATGFDGPASSDLTLSAIANAALADHDLLSAVEGQTFSGSLPAGASYTFVVTGTHYGATSVHLSPGPSSLSVTGSVANVEVDGNLTVKVFGL